MHVSSENKESKLLAMYLPAHSGPPAKVQVSPIKLRRGGVVIFTRHFQYLRTIISADLNDSYNIKKKIVKVNNYSVS